VDPGAPDPAPSSLLLTEGVKLLAKSTDGPVKVGGSCHSEVDGFMAWPGMAILIAFHVASLGCNMV
jgi:hypothetical protein